LLELLLHQLIFSVESTLWKTKVDRFLFQNIHITSSFPPFWEK
jgi:hypothetical protein